MSRIAARTSPRRTFGPRCGCACASPNSSATHGGGPGRPRRPRGPSPPLQSPAQPLRCCPQRCSMCRLNCRPKSSVPMVVLPCGRCPRSTLRRPFTIYRDRTSDCRRVQEVRCRFCPFEGVATTTNVRNTRSTGYSVPPRPSQLVAAAGEVGALGGVVGEGEGGLVGGAGLVGAVEATEELGASGVPEVVRREVEAVDLGEADGGAVELGEGHGAVEGDDGRGSDREQLAVQRGDLGPVG